MCKRNDLKKEGRGTIPVIDNEKYKGDRKPPKKMDVTQKRTMHDNITRNR